MKKLLFLFFASVILISCESDNDSDLDPIIGSWKLTSLLIDGEESLITDECSKKEFQSFFVDGKVLDNRFIESSAGDCEAFEHFFNWKNLGNSAYLIDDLKFQIEFSNNNTNYKFTLKLKDANNEDIKAVFIHSKI